MIDLRLKQILLSSVNKTSENEHFQLFMISNKRTELLFMSSQMKMILIILLKPMYL